MENKNFHKPTSDKLKKIITKFIEENNHKVTEKLSRLTGLESLGAELALQ